MSLHFTKKVVVMFNLVPQTTSCADHVTLKQFESTRIEKFDESCSMSSRNLLLFLHTDCVCCFRWNSCGDVQLQETGSSGHKPKQFDRINPHPTGIHRGPIPIERISQRTLRPNSYPTANGADTEHHRLLIQQLVRGHPTVRLIQCVSL